MNKKRIGKLQTQIENPILIKKPENIFYLLGKSFLHGYLFVKPFSARRLRADGSVIFFGNGLEKVKKIHSDILKNLRMYLGRFRVLEIEDQFTFAEYSYLKKKISTSPASFPRSPFAEASKDKQGRRIQVKHVRSPVDFLRMVKSQNEIALIKKSMQIVEKVFALVRKEINQPGITEIKLARFITKNGLRLGASDISFPPIVASGANAAIPHHTPSSKKLKAGESIIIDFGFKYKGYCSDFTRTVFLKKVPKRLEIVYNQVEKAYNQSIEFIKSPFPNPSRQGRGIKSVSSPFVGRIQEGVKAGDVYQKAVDVLKENHLEKYFIHNLGHGTGLEIHELPNLSPGSKDVLKDNMVFSIEPGVYIPKIGGVRIEDLVYLEKGRVEKFIRVSAKLKDNIL